MKKLYLFDFDGTITYHDTLFLFLKFYNKQRFLVQFAKHIPLFILLKLHLADAEKVKRSFISSVLKGESKETLTTKAQEFFTRSFPAIIRENAIEFINNIDHQKTDCYLVTASLDIWVKPFADHFKMKLIATKAEFKDGIFTGNFVGANCNNQEKLNRIQQVVSRTDYDKVIAFGDTSGDLPMLNWADESQYQFFH